MNWWKTICRLARKVSESSFWMDTVPPNTGAKRLSEAAPVGEVETEDFDGFYGLQPPTDPLADRRARAEELLRRLQNG